MWECFHLSCYNFFIKKEKFFVNYKQNYFLQTKILVFTYLDIYLNIIPNVFLTLYDEIIHVWIEPKTFFSFHRLYQLEI